jgi:hypothetical protein
MCDHSGTTIRVGESEFVIANSAFSPNVLTGKRTASDLFRAAPASVLTIGSAKRYDMLAWEKAELATLLRG